MKVLNILVYEAIAAVSAVSTLVGESKNKKRKGKKNVRGRGRDWKGRVQETSVGSSLFLSIIHLRQRSRLIMMSIQNRDVEPADPTAQDTGVLGAPGQAKNMETE
jgi:hypothetical protein